MPEPDAKCLRAPLRIIAGLKALVPGGGRDQRTHAPRGEFRVGAQDVLLGHVAGDVPVWIGAAQFEYWRHTQVTIDVVRGRGAGMSLGSPEGSRFIIRSKVFNDEEAAALEAAGEPVRGA